MTCLNGGRRPMAGLPCSCPTGFYGLRCEYGSGSSGSNNWPYNNVQGYCSSYPCQNGGVRSYILIVSFYFHEFIFIFYRLYRNVRREPLVTFANADTTFMDLDANIVRIFRVYIKGCSFFMSNFDAESSSFYSSFTPIFFGRKSESSNFSFFTPKWSKNFGMKTLLIILD